MDTKYSTQKILKAEIFIPKGQFAYVGKLRIENADEKDLTIILEIKNDNT